MKRKTGRFAMGLVALTVAGAVTTGCNSFEDELYDMMSDQLSREKFTSTDMFADEVSEETEEEEIEAEVSETPKFDDNCKAIYLEVLSEHKSGINSYKQYREELGSGVAWYDLELEVKGVSIEDVTGDGIPELIFVEPAEGDEGEYKNGLNIYTTDGESAKQIYYDEDWDIQVAGGSIYSLFLVDGESTLYACNGVSDESTVEEYYRIDVQEDGTMTKTEIMERRVGPNEDYTQTVATCTISGESVGEEVFQSELDALTGRMTKLLLYNRDAHDANAVEAMKNAEACYLTYDEAVALLSDGQVESEEAKSEDSENTLPFESKKFLFSSGFGMWATVITINADGSFEGEFSDLDMGDGGEGYDSTMHISNFHGKFTQIEKKDEYTYTMKLDSLEYEESQDEWIEDNDDGGRTRYIASEAYGIADGSTFELYLPGTPVAGLSEQYMTWANGYGIQDGSSLSEYGLYNVDVEYGFTGRSD